MDKGVKRAMGELKWAIQKLAYSAEYLNKCMEEIEEALRVAERAAESLQMVTECSSRTPSL